VEVALGDTEAPVLGDHGELEQLFLNLLINAQEATPAEGRVAVRVARVDDRATVEITDSGPGIPADMLERVFDPFFTTKQRGSGLGLTVCAGIAAAHRARLLAANAAEGGARFTVDFPLAVGVPAVAS
jgi:signal transduction histidine kinase